MRARMLIVASLALNALLVVLWLTARSKQTDAAGEARIESPASGSTTTNVVVRRQFFTWAELESDDYAQYIANLRSINCPEETIRDIIIADVDQLFARRRATETLPAIRQWWQSTPDPSVVAAADRQLEALDRERRALLESLLGPDWDVPSGNVPVVAIKVPLDGPLLGSLPEETQQAIQRISGQAQARFERILAGNPRYPDPAALASLESWISTQLTPLLSPGQLEEFMYRYAPTAQSLRTELASIPLFNASLMEMQNVFRNTESIELQLMSLKGVGPAVDAQRNALNRSREIAIQNALGPDRYREYQRLLDPAYQQAIAAAQKAGISNAADLFYLIDQVGLEEQANIRQATNLTPLQEEIAIRQMELEQLQVAAEAVGQSNPPEPPAPPQRTYNFQKGDNIAEISMKTGVPVALILQANPGLKPDQIAPGTQIIIPDWPTPFPP